MTLRMRAFAIAAAIAAGALAAILVIAPPASAHASFVSSTPAAGETLAELPDEFSVTMNETLLAGAGDAAFALRIRDVAGLYYGDGCLTIVDATVSTPAALGEPGDYTLEWQVVSADGHPVSGEVPFGWAPHEPAPDAAAGSSGPPACGVVPDAAAPDDTDADGSGHHGDTASEVAVSDVLWIVGAVLAAAIAVTVALIATRRRPRP